MSKEVKIRDHNKYMERITTYCKMGEIFEWDKWIKEIPFIKFPRTWKIKFIPPFNGAVVRFLVSRKGKNNVSVYLDCYDILGFMMKPYWETYPYEGDCGRCEMNDIPELLRMIKRGLNEIEKEEIK